MSDVPKPPGRTVSRPSNPALPAANAPGQGGPRPSNPALPAANAPGQGGPRPPKVITNPGTLRVMTATRAQPPPPEPPKKLSERLKAIATDAALNAVSIGREMVEDFRRSDKYFKYKAGILGGWVLISILTMFISCPHASELDATNRLGARLGPASSDPLHPAITIFNESDDPWDEVTVIVNKTYRAAAGRVQGHGGYLTITPKQLIGPDNNLAPLDLKVTDVELRTDDGRARLMKEGRVR